MLVARLHLVVAGALLLAAGCAERPPRVVGEGCELTAECAAPFVCRLGACREECREARDCRVGLLCVRTEGLGVCQVPDESECELTSDCPDGLVCRFETCTTACLSDRDCATGTICDVVDDDTLACRDPTEDECRLNSQCPEPLICARDLRCRVECRSQRDCRDGTRCDTMAVTPSCVPPAMLTDAGMDAPMDAPMDALADAPPPDVPVDAMDSGTPLSPLPPFTVSGTGRTGGYLDETTGELRLWGVNGVAQVGVPASSSELPTTVSVPGGAVRTFSTGATHTCALSDRIYCWGDNAQGQLGRDPAGDLGGPTASPLETPLTGVVGLSLGLQHSCAWTNTDVRCWGDDASGQLGDGSAGGFAHVPATPSLGGPPLRVAAGQLHTCAIRDDGQLLCWGRNASGELGDGSIIDRPTPTPVSIPATVTEVALGRSHTCALHAGGAVRCWGENTRGQLGTGATSPAEPPTLVAGLGAAVQVTAGVDHSCALTSAGAIMCWGNGSDGRLGASIAFPGWEPTPLVSALSAGAQTVSAGIDYTCAHYGAGMGECVGSNDLRQFGTDDTMMREVPVSVTWSP